MVTQYFFYPRYQDTRATKENRARAGRVTKRSPASKSKSSKKMAKRNKNNNNSKRVLKPKRTSSYSTTTPTSCDINRQSSSNNVLLHPSINQPSGQPAVSLSPNNPCDTSTLPAATTSDYVVYTTEPNQIEYVVYDQTVPHHHVIQGQQVVAQVEPVPHQQVLVYEDEGRQEAGPKDYVLYREDNEEAASPKDVNVISLYISLIDGKRLNSDV